MDHVWFLLVLLSEPRDASRPQSDHSCSATETVLAALAPLIAQGRGLPRGCPLELFESEGGRRYGAGSLSEDTD